MKLIKDYTDQWNCEVPALIPDGGGGTLLLEERETQCECGGKAIMRVSFVHEGTRRPDLKELGFGALVKHYYTHCLKDKTHISVS